MHTLSCTGGPYDGRTLDVDDGIVATGTFTVPTLGPRAMAALPPGTPRTRSRYTIESDGVTATWAGDEPVE